MDAQLAPGPAQPAAVDLGPRQVRSLTDILGQKPSTEERRPDPVQLAWNNGTRKVPCPPCNGLGKVGIVQDVDGVPDESTRQEVVCSDCEGAKTIEVPDDLVMEVKVHYPANPYVMQVEFLELSRLEQTPEVGADGKETFPNEDAALMALIHEMVEEPMWLKNRSAFQQFKKAAPLAVAALKRKLMNTGGLDADFFADSRAFMEPALRSLLVSASQNASASRQSRQKPSPPANSPGSSTTTASDATKTESATSQTTSGSSPSTPTTAPPTADRPPTPLTVTS